MWRVILRRKKGGFDENVVVGAGPLSRSVPALELWWLRQRLWAATRLRLLKIPSPQSSPSTSTQIVQGRKQKSSRKSSWNLFIRVKGWYFYLSNRFSFLRLFFSVLNVVLFSPGEIKTFLSSQKEKQIIFSFKISKLRFLPIRAFCHFSLCL